MKRSLCLAVLLVGLATPAFAQLDPLLFIKNGATPNVLLVVDVSQRMQKDANGDYYDQFVYPKGGAAYEAQLGLTGATYTTGYLRKYVALADVVGGSDKMTATTIVAVGNLQTGYSTFDSATRWGVARRALVQAVQQNLGVARFGLLKMRQSNPRMGTQGDDGPVAVSDANLQAPTDGWASGRWHITRPLIDSSNGQVVTAPAPQVKADVATANSDILTLLGKAPNQGGLVPASGDDRNTVDAPVDYMLVDAKAEASRLIAADGAACRNTVVVLVVGGSDGNSVNSGNPATRASEFLSIASHRVPIYVIAIAPTAADNTSQLQSIAANSGGQYFEVTAAMISATTPGAAVGEAVRAVNTAVQHSYASFTDFNTRPTSALPYGPSTEFQASSPLTGTVNLANARDINGATLSNTVITAPISGNLIPQRSNVMLTAGFALPGPVSTPGFPGRLHAFRVYKPVADSTKAAGYKFVSDGTPLWVASLPAAASRNIYTTLPDGTMVAFSTANAATLAPYLRVGDAAGLISYIRNQPLGAIVSGTPAVLEPPSLDPPPDADYPAFIQANKDRRSLIFVGANDGMLHAIDGRLGVEVWAFIPFNLLPKLQALRAGQPVGSFQFFVDSSPKLADVKIDGAWRSYLVFGEGPGGTFYQTLDLTLDGMASSVDEADDSVANVLSYFANPNRIALEWSFPRYSDFDCTVSPYGDISTGASDLAKSVGQTWSDPAVGEVESLAGRFVVLAGSGFLPYSQQRQANRYPAPSTKVAGTTFYMIDARDGTVLDSRDVGSDGVAETVDSCSAVNDCTKLKNAVQADPVATGPPDSRFVTQAYIGDLDGRLWRFTIGLNGSHVPYIKTGPTKLYDAGASQPLFASLAVVNVGGANQYIFAGTGSDLLPSNGVSQSYKLLGILDNGSTGSLSFSVSLEKTDGAGTDEKVSAYPAVAGDIVFFSTTSYKPGQTCAIPDANVYALTFIGGPAYDNTGDNMVTKKDTPKVITITSGGRATAPFIVDQHLAIAAGGTVELFGDPQDFNNGVGQVSVRFLSWRERR